MGRNNTYRILNNKMARIFTIIFSLLFISGIYGNSPGTETQIKACIQQNTEEVFVHLNKKVFITGEELFYRIYFLRNSMETKATSDIVYFELRDVSDKLVCKWRTPRLNKKLAGSYTLPDTLNTGLYYLYAYTNILRNYPVNQQFCESIIITPINELNTGSIVLNNIKSKSGEAATSSPISCDLKKDKFSRGEEIKLSFSGNTINACNLSVSVNEKTPFDAYLNSPTGNSPLHISDIISEENDYYIKESGSFSIKGFLINKETHEPLKNVLVFASVLGNSANLNYAYTNEYGMFRIFLDNKFDNNIIYFQLYQTELMPENVAWNFSDNLEIKEKSNITTTQLNTQQQEYLVRQRSAELVKRVYSIEHVNADSIVNGVQTSFYLTPDNIIYPKDYEELGTFKEIASNILTGVRFNKTDEGYNISVVINKTQMVADKGVMVFLNGIPISNYAFLNTLSSDDIERIELCNREYMFGDLTFYGVVSIFTYEKAFDLASFNKPFYLYDNIVAGRISNNSANWNISVPNISSQAYWNSDITIVGSENRTILFTTPKITGEFKIDIKGQDANGQLFSIVKEFKVE